MPLSVDQSSFTLSPINSAVFTNVCSITNKMEGLNFVLELIIFSICPFHKHVQYLYLKLYIYYDNYNGSFTFSLFINGLQIINLHIL